LPCLSAASATGPVSTALGTGRDDIANNFDAVMAPGGADAVMRIRALRKVASTRLRIAAAMLLGVSAPTLRKSRM